MSAKFPLQIFQRHKGCAYVNDLKYVRAMYIIWNKHPVIKDVLNKF